MVPEIKNYSLLGKPEHRLKNFGANLNIFVVAARTVRFSGKAYYDVRTHIIQSKFFQNSKENFFQISGANMNKCPKFVH
jgi:hypothetical protein